jgi:hypothetical protein
MSDRLHLTFFAALSASLACYSLACGSSAPSLAPGDGGVDAGGDAPIADSAQPDADASRAADSATTDGGAAASITATQNALCTAIAPFYWEIGNQQGALVAGSTGSGIIQADTQLNIASASKLFFGAYVVERFASDITQIDLSSMTMRSGRTNFGDCTGTATVDACCAKTGASGGTSTNCDVVQADVGYFDYGGGHFQGYASTLGLGGDDDTGLATELTGKLGTELSFSFTQPQLAGGIKTSAAVYGQLLRKILSGSLAISAHLGENAVCTLPSVCPTSHYSPSPLAWHYSYGHWVEDEPDTGDGAFCSPGKFGFYPWIDASKTYYGIVAREDVATGTSLETAPYYQSVLCGRAIRKAFVTGVPQ